MKIPKFIEGNLPATVAERVGSELFRHQSFGHNTVRILNTERACGRYVYRMMHYGAYAKSPADFEMPQDGTILITGGNGALGLLMGTWLMKKAKEQEVSGITVKFLSRSAKIPKDNEKMWKQIEKEASAMNITVVQDKVDLGSQESVDEFVASFNGGIAGIIHSAGILKDATLANIVWEDFITQYETKHFPAIYLHCALEKMEQDKLKFFWLFSSAAAYGNMGQLNYSGCNSFLDSLGRHRKALGKPCQVFQWAGWGEIGMAANMDKVLLRRMEMSMMPMFTNKEGLGALENGIGSSCPVIACIKLNVPVGLETAKMEGSAAAHFNRNFFSEILPTPVPTLKRDNLMTMIRTQRGLYQWQRGNGWLVWYDFVLPRLAEDYGDEVFELFDI